MKIICVVKFIPDLHDFSYDFENNRLTKERGRMVLNPDDVCALAFALNWKAAGNKCSIEVVTMAPYSVIPHMEDLLRLGVDKAVLLSDPKFAGSDTYATSQILGRYIALREFDTILTGNQALDGGTSHVPAQLGELLHLEHMAGVVEIDESQFHSKRVIVHVETETSFMTFEILQPCILSLSRESKYKLPYPTYEALKQDLSEKVKIIDSLQLSLPPDEVGLKGSLTQVVKTYNKTYQTRSQKLISSDEQGIEQLFQFLLEKGFIQ